MYLMQEGEEGVPFQYSATCPHVQEKWQIITSTFQIIWSNLDDTIFERELCHQLTTIKIFKEKLTLQRKVSNYVHISSQIFFLLK